MAECPIDASPDSLASRALDLLLSLTPVVGSWNQVTQFREPDPVRLLLLAHLRHWGGSEKAGQLRAFVGESRLAASLHLALDLALAQLIEGQTGQRDSDGVRQALGVARRYVDRRIGAQAALDHLLECRRALPDDPRSWGEGADEARFHARRALLRATEAVALCAALEVDRLADFRALEANTPEALRFALSADDGARPTLLDDLVGRIGQIGRRNFSDRFDSLMSIRAIWQAASLLLDRGEGTQPDALPMCLLHGFPQALDYAAKAQLTPATPPDGAGQFRFGLGTDHVSQRQAPRRIAGYAFTAAGEAVYVVDTGDGYVTKRAWKAHAEYQPFGQGAAQSRQLACGAIRVAHPMVSWREIPLDRFVAG